MTTVLQGPNYLPFDIETIANKSAKEYYASKVYEAPANYKDPEKIEKYILEARHNDEKKAALSWWTGRIVCISVRSIFKKTRKTFVGEDEAKILSAFFTWVEAEGRFLLVGKSSKHFDTPFILGRCLALDIGVPQFLRPHRPIEDIDEVFGFGARADQASTLANYAAGLGIKGKGGHGTDVQYWYNAATTGKDPDGFKKIATYCDDDVDIVEEFMHRFSKVWTPIGVKTPESEAVAMANAGIAIPFGGTMIPENRVEEPELPPVTEAKKPRKAKAEKPDNVARMIDPEPAKPAILQHASPLEELEFE